MFAVCTAARDAIQIITIAMFNFAGVNLIPLHMSFLLLAYSVVLYHRDLNSKS